MLFYSITGKNHNKVNPYFHQSIRKIEKNILIKQKNIMFYFNIFDEIFHSISINECLDQESIEILKKDKGSKLIIDFQYEVITFIDVEKLNIFIKNNSISLDKLVIIVQDRLQQNFIEKFMICNNKLPTVKIFAMHYFSASKGLTTTEKIDKKKFSMLVRRHEFWRLRLLLKLEKKQLLSNFIYSYLGIDNSTDTVYNGSNLSTPISAEERYLLNRLPIKFSANDNIDHRNNKEIFKALNSAKINVVVETVYSQQQYTFKSEYDYSYAPTDLSEKLLKSIVISKPFIVVATPYFLSTLKELGYKTFDPYINEDYDLEIDNNKRLSMIVDEIERISKLSKSEFNSIIKHCNEIAEYNKNLFLNHLLEYEILSKKIFKNS